MAFNNPVPVCRVKLIDGREDWAECEREDCDAWYVEWGVHGKGWFHAIVDSEAEGEELLRKCSFIG